MEEINDRWKRFSEEYIIDLNAKQAAIRAGYSAATATQMGYKLLVREDVQQYITQLKAERSKRTAITADKVLAEFAKIAFANIKDYYGEDDYTLKPISELSRLQMAAIESIETIEKKFQGEITEKRKKIKMYNKLSALENLARHLGLYEKDNMQRPQSEEDQKTIVFPDGTKVTL